MIGSFGVGSNTPAAIDGVAVLHFIVELAKSKELGAVLNKLEAESRALVQAGANAAAAEQSARAAAATAEAKIAEQKAAVDAAQKVQREAQALWASATARCDELLSDANAKAAAIVATAEAEAEQVRSEVAARKAMLAAAANALH